jgi:ABC-2 type transport system permease protein
MSEVFAYLLPGMMYFWVMFIGQGPLQEILLEKESHVLPRLLSAPVTLSQYLIAKIVRSFLLCCLVMGLLMLVSALLFGIRWGNPLRLAVVIAACALSMTGLLSVVYGLARTREQANAFSSMLLLFCAMIGGSMFPFENLPVFLQVIGQCVPNRWGVLAMQGMAQAKPFGQLLAPLGGLLLSGVVGNGIAFFLLRRHLLHHRGT